MSIFKTKGIILKIDIINSNKSNGIFLYTIFTNDYGKIKCNKKFSKKEKKIDIGYIINFEIYTKENLSIHKIKNIKILSEFDYSKKSFNELNNYLILLSVILNKIPLGLPIYEIFHLLEFINSNKNINEIKLILAKLKIISILGELNENISKKIIINKILKFINNNKINKIILLSGINEEIKNELFSI